MTCINNRLLSLTIQVSCSQKITITVRTNKTLAFLQRILYIIHVMNENHSQPELKYRPRWLADALKAAVKHHRIVVLTGARQVGKSTLLRKEEPFSGWHYINLDNYDLLSQARTNPESLWIDKTEVVIDEVQKAPGLLEAVKATIDTHPHHRFILSGSSNILLMKQVSESLAGRAVYFKLNPMCLSEMKYIPCAGNLEKVFKGKLPEKDEKDEIVISSNTDTAAYMLKGFMPALLEMNSQTAVLQWWDGYVRTYLERDLRQITRIESLPDYRRVMTALALRSGQVLNQTAVSRELDISQPTVHRYINLLETSYMVERIPAFTVNRNKRLTKSPKVLWNDPALVCFLCGYSEPDELLSSNISGGVFETMIYMHINAEIQLMTPIPRLYFWRTSTGKEVDFVIEWGRKLVAVEVKLADQVRYSDLHNLRIFMEEYPETTASLVIYAGNEIKIMDKDIIAVPWYLI